LVAAVTFCISSFQRVIGDLGKFFGLNLPKGSLSPTVGVSFGLPTNGPGYGGYQQNPVGTGGAINPYYDSNSGLSVGAVKVNPLVSFQATTGENGDLVAKPLINLHLTPNGCGLFGCELDEYYNNRKAGSSSKGGVIGSALDLLFPKKKQSQPNYDYPHQPEHHTRHHNDQQYQYNDQQYQHNDQQYQQNDQQYQQNDQQYQHNTPQYPQYQQNNQQYTPQEYVPPVNQNYPSNRKEFGPELPPPSHDGHHHQSNGNVNGFGSNTKKVSFGSHDEPVVKHEHHHFHHHEHKGRGQESNLYYDDAYKRTNQLKRDSTPEVNGFKPIVGTSQDVPISEARGQQKVQSSKEASGGAFRFPSSGRSLTFDDEKVTEEEAGEDDKSTAGQKRKRRSPDHGGTGGHHHHEHDQEATATTDVQPVRGGLDGSHS
jgi:hypothetical protein